MFGVVILGLVYPLGSRTWWVLWVLVAVLLVLGIRGFLAKRR